jgi:hypothetical protein
VNENPKTIEYLQHRVEVDLPRQIEKAMAILGRMTLRFHDQLEFKLEETTDNR